MSAAVAVLMESLRDERDLCDRLAAELAKHGWGDMHYSVELRQDPAIVVLLEEHRGRRAS